MNRVEFMSQLERLLGDIPESDRQDAIAYYNDYFDEAGVENEARVIQELGSPGRVAATIKADLHTSGNEQAEYTEQGYSDGREKKAQDLPSKSGNASRGMKGKRTVPLPLIIILIIFAAPFLIGAGGGLLGGFIGIVCAIFGILIAAIACGVSLIIAGLVCFVVGIVRIVISPIEGIITTGVGSLMLAVGILLTLLFLWATVKWFPAMFRGIVNWIQSLFQRSERRERV